MTMFIAKPDGLPHLATIRPMGKGNNLANGNKEENWSACMRKNEKYLMVLVSLCFVLIFLHIILRFGMYFRQIWDIHLEMFLKGSNCGILSEQAVAY